MTKTEIARSRIAILLVFCGFLFGLHFGAGWSWQLSWGLAMLDELTARLALISRQLDR